MLSIIIVYFEVLYQRELSFFFYFSFLFSFIVDNMTFGWSIARCLLKQLTLEYRSLHSRYFFLFLSFFLFFFLFYVIVGNFFWMNDLCVRDILSIPSSENNNNFPNLVNKRCCATHAQLDHEVFPFLLPVKFLIDSKFIYIGEKLKSRGSFPSSCSNKFPT